MLQARSGLNFWTYTCFSVTAIQMSYKAFVLHDRDVCATAKFKWWPIPTVHPQHLLYIWSKQQEPGRMSTAVSSSSSMIFQYSLKPKNVSKQLAFLCTDYILIKTSFIARIPLLSLLLVTCSKWSRTNLKAGWCGGKKDEKYPFSPERKKIQEKCRETKQSLSTAPVFWGKTNKITEIKN